MTQIDRSQETRKEVRPGLTENYTPAANVLIQGFPELSISERYVVIGLVCIYRNEEVYPVSLRELAAKIQIDHTALRSRAGKRPCEGILDKLWRLGIIGLMEGKPLTDLGNKGRVQTFIRVNHRYIAEQNQNYTLGKKVRTVRSITVENTNSTPEGAGVENDNYIVGNNNHTVGILNDVVGDTNHTVVHVSTNVPPKKEKNSNNSKESKERDNGEHTTQSNDGGFAIAPTHAPTEEKVLVSYSQNTDNPPSKQDLEKNVVVAGDGYMQPDAKEEAKPEQGELLVVESGPLAMPPASAKWCAKTAVIISEVLRNKRYTSDQEKNQQNAATRMFKTFPKLTRAQFEEIFTDWVKWWHSKGKGVFTLADLMAKNYQTKEIRLRTDLDRLEAKRKPNMPTPSQPATTQEIDPSKPVVWTRYKHTGSAVTHWYLYNPEMPLAEALQYGYKPDMISLSDRRDIKAMHRELVEGCIKLTPEQKTELETAEVRLRLVA